MAIYTPHGTLVGTYSYDPYGRITQIKHNDNYKDVDGILEKNPFRYRSYYYDTETGWYYLNSRYYDPEVKRFINGDSTQLLTNTPENLMQYNMFMYCNGDPVNVIDDNGENGIAIVVIGALVAATAITYGYVVSQNYRLNYSVNVSDSLAMAMDSVQEKIKSGVEEFTLRNQNIYFLEDSDGVAYVGRTKNLTQRIDSHQNSLNRDHLVYNPGRTISNLTLAEARALEQIEMLVWHTYRSGKKGCNAINGIRLNNPKLFEYFIATQLSGVSDYAENQLVDLLYNWLEGNL